MPRHASEPNTLAESLSGARGVFILAVACGTEWLAAWLPDYGSPGDRLAMTVIGATIGWLAFVAVAHYQLDRHLLTLRAPIREWLAGRPTTARHRKAARD